MRIGFLFLVLFSSCQGTCSKNSVVVQEGGFFKDESSLIPTDSRSLMCMDVEAVDIDSDGDKDLILAIEFGANKLLINDGTGKFEDKLLLPKSQRDSEDIVPGDFDNNGYMDIFIVSEDDKINELFLQDAVGFKLCGLKSSSVRGNNKRRIEFRC